MATSASVKDSVRTAAVDLFARHGFTNTSVQQIVDAAGVTKGAMYHYFRSKDELLFGIYEHLLTLQSEHLAAIMTTGDSTPQKLRAACIDVIETSITFLDEGTVFFHSAHLLPTEKQREVKVRRRVYNDHFAALVQAGQSEGIYRTDIPRAVLVANFFSDLHYLPQWYSADGPEEGSLIALQLTDLFLAGISTAKLSPVNTLTKESR
jgi:AcrR family transcriptional regulator